MATAKQKRIAKLVDLYQANMHLFKLFQEGVSNALRFDPTLNHDPHPIIHSIKTRLKDPSHLAEKIARKELSGKEITEATLFTDITDLSGVRILHLHQAQAVQIHEFIIRRVTDKEWHLVEKPVAYSWDPDATEFFQNLGLKVKIKPSHYTSIHYVVRPKKGAQ